MSWVESRANCKRYRADLVSILNLSEADFIYRQTSSLVSDYFWIGLHKIKTTSDFKKGWVWSDGSSFTNPKQWGQGEPKNEDGNKYCAQVFSQRRNWNSGDCGFPESSICKRKKGNFRALFNRNSRINNGDRTNQVLQFIPKSYE